MKFLRDFNFKKKKVLFRADFNIPLSKDKEIDNKEDWRIEATLPSINYLLDRGASIILLSHLGRPKGRIIENLRLNSVVRRLEKLLKKDIIKLNSCLGPEVKDKIENMNLGEIIVLENIRFYPEEENNDRDFAKLLASYGDIYVNDAFSVSHRAHASLVGIPEFLPSCAGLLLEKEINALSGVLENAKRPLVVIIGGAKISTKIKFIKKFLIKADDLLLGGALANTAIAAKGFAIGRSISEQGMIEDIKKMDLTNIKLHLPVDAVASVDPSGKKGSRIAPIGKTKEDEMILDIGPDTIKLFKNIISQAETIIWNGPMGIIEVKEFINGSMQMAQLVANSKAFSIVGGGDSIYLLEKVDLLDKIDHICTGGGAMLKFLAGEKLPGIEALN